jgi:hypothetical protein
MGQSCQYVDKALQVCFGHRHLQTAMDQTIPALGQSPQMISFGWSDVALGGEHLNEPARGLRPLEFVRKYSSTDRLEGCPSHEKSWTYAAVSGEFVNGLYRLLDRIAGHTFNRLGSTRGAIQ